jgi:predicted RNase H-like nuclease (RuvC/YqgF family)
MRKKRSISDLLREEVKGTPANATPEGDRASNRETVTTSSSSKPRSHSENQVKELTNALESAIKRATSLENQVTSLESELEAQKNLVATLQNQLQQATEIKTKLEEKEQLVQKLYLELEEQKQLVEKLYAELQQAQEQQEVKNSDRLVVQTVSTYGIDPRPIGPYLAANQPSLVLSNEEIGWFD